MNIESPPSSGPDRNATIVPHGQHGSFSRILEILGTTTDDSMDSAGDVNFDDDSATDDIDINTSDDDAEDEDVDIDTRDDEAEDEDSDTIDNEAEDEDIDTSDDESVDIVPDEGSRAVLSPDMPRWKLPAGFRPRKGGSALLE